MCLLEGLEAGCSALNRIVTVTLLVILYSRRIKYSELTSYGIDRMDALGATRNNNNPTLLSLGIGM